MHRAGMIRVILFFRFEKSPIKMDLGIYGKLFCRIGFSEPVNKFGWDELLKTSWQPYIA